MAVVAAPAAVDQSADCCGAPNASPGRTARRGPTTAVDFCTTAVAADPSDVPRLPSLAQGNGWNLPVGARRPTQAGEEGRTRPSRQFLAFSVPADGRSCREP